MDDIFEEKALAKLLKEHQAMLDRWIENALHRDEVINRGAPYCARCGSQQVQIMDKGVPAKWRCRMCRYRFEYEPPALTAAERD